MQSTQTFFGNVRSDAPAQNCGFNPVAAAAEQRRAAAESVKNLPALEAAAKADALAVKAIDEEYNMHLRAAAALLQKLLAAQVVAGRSGEAFGKAKEAKQKFERERQVGPA